MCCGFKPHLIINDSFVIEMECSSLYLDFLDFIRSKHSHARTHTAVSEKKSVCYSFVIVCIVLVSFEKWSNVLEMQKLKV